MAAVIAFVAVAATAEDDIFPRFIVRLSPFPTCADDAPVSKWDAVSCKDLELDSSLLQNAASGDHSAVALLECRYAEASTHAEHILLGAALLGRVADDGPIWKELAAEAERYVESRDDETAAKQAFEEIAGDRRARPLLLRALASNDTDLLNKAILGLSLQHDESTLPTIEKALQRFPEEASRMALSLIDFKTENADTLAMKYLKDDDRALYEQERAER
ncbi:MAG TPA: hypothetical protein VG323_00780 [Thermoanaerobaculia bacterium]|nr:hypothetical protein [Thermoanaerobaculia bacterium]